MNFFACMKCTNLVKSIDRKVDSKFDFNKLFFYQDNLHGLTCLSPIIAAILLTTCPSNGFQRNGSGRSSVLPVNDASIISQNNTYIEFLSDFIGVFHPLTGTNNLPFQI